jgi:replication-associated recombination protein RarA
MRSEAFDSARLVIMVASVVVRLALLPKQLQAYLDMAQRRLDQQKKEAGRITNIDLQKKVTHSMATAGYRACT